MSGEVVISDVDPEIFDQLLCYVHTGAFNSQLQLSALSKLLSLANKYLLTDLIALVLLRILDILTDAVKMKSQDAMALAELLAFSDVASVCCPTFQKKLIKSILKHRSEVIKDQSFLKQVAGSSAPALAELLAPLHTKGDDNNFRGKRRKKDTSLESSLWASGSCKLCPSWAKLDETGSVLGGGMEVLQGGA